MTPQETSRPNHQLRLQRRWLPLHHHDPSRRKMAIEQVAPSDKRLGSLAPAGRNFDTRNLKPGNRACSR